MRSWCVLLALLFSCLCTTSSPASSLWGKGKTLSPKCIQTIRERCNTVVCYTEEGKFMSPVGLLRLREFERTGRWIPWQEALQRCRKENS